MPGRALFGFSGGRRQAAIGALAVARLLFRLFRTTFSESAAARVARAASAVRAVRAVRAGRGASFVSRSLGPRRHLSTLI